MCLHVSVCVGKKVKNLKWKHFLLGNILIKCKNELTTRREEKRKEKKDREKALQNIFSKQNVELDSTEICFLLFFHSFVVLERFYFLCAPTQ